MAKRKARMVRDTAAARAKRNSLGHTDFEGAFKDGQEFVGRERKTNVTVLKERAFVTPSGKIIACDPFGLRFHLRPFVRTVEPGSYPVVMSFTDTNWPCALMVAFSRRKPVSWEMAVRVDEDPDYLRSGGYICHGVDAGMSCFADAAGAKAFVDRNLSVDDEFAEIGNSFDQRTGALCKFVLDPKTKANLVATYSGYGDGAYPSYWGFDRDGGLACLVTDFLVLVEEERERIEFDEIGRRFGKELEHPTLEKLGFSKLVVKRRKETQWPRKLAAGITVSYKGEESLDVALVNRKGKSLFKGGVYSQGKHQIICDLTKIQDATLVVTVSLGIRPMARADAK